MRLPSDCRPVGPTAEFHALPLVGLARVRPVFFPSQKPRWRGAKLCQGMPGHLRSSRPSCGRGTCAIAFARASRTSPAVLGGSMGAASVCGSAAALRPCLEPIFAASLGSKCRAHFSPQATAHAPHRSPFLFFAEHRFDIVQTLAICRFSPFNGRGAPLSGLGPHRAVASEP